MLIYQNFFLCKSAIFHPIELPFDVEVAEKNLKCYLLPNKQSRYIEVAQRGVSSRAIHTQLIVNI